MLTAPFARKKVKFPVPRYTKQDVLFLKDLIEAKQYQAVVDRRYALDDVVEATAYVETEQKTGNVVLTVPPTTARRRGLRECVSRSTSDRVHR